ncbi:hypothetical protein [Solirubrobacter pauli]|uniref:hypothetical protein n=1 Tax=Solirubrobacter pauli TaxID=166793 RepID=UPI000EAF4398|nr:hypothetical protein [Solirubrobacter pauli]
MPEFWRGQRIYAEHVLGLLAPGREIPSHSADRVAAASLAGWSPYELFLMIEEGRRELDRQARDFERVQARAQWLYTVAAAVTAAIGTTLVKGDPTFIHWVLGLVALVLLGWGTAGAVAIVVVRADFSVIHAPVLSGLARPVDFALAETYAGMMSTGANTVATRVTVLRQAVVLVATGGYLGLLSSLLMQ